MLDMHDHELVGQVVEFKSFTKAEEEVALLFERKRDYTSYRVSRLVSFTWAKELLWKFFPCSYI